MMVDPVNSDKNKTQDVAEEDRQQASKRLPIGAMRHLQLQNHDRNDDSDHTAAECIQSFLVHLSPSRRHQAAKRLLIFQRGWKWLGATAAPGEFGRDSPARGAMSAGRSSPSARGG